MAKLCGIRKVSVPITGKPAQCSHYDPEIRAQAKEYFDEKMSEILTELIDHLVLFYSKPDLVGHIFEHLSYLGREVTAVFIIDQLSKEIAMPLEVSQLTPTSKESLLTELGSYFRGETSLVSLEGNRFVVPEGIVNTPWAVYIAESGILTIFISSMAKISQHIHGYIAAYFSSSHRPRTSLSASQFATLQLANGGRLLPPSGDLLLSVFHTVMKDKATRLFREDEAGNRFACMARGIVPSLLIYFTFNLALVATNNEERIIGQELSFLEMQSRYEAIRQQIAIGLGREG